MLFSHTGQNNITHLLIDITVIIFILFSLLAPNQKLNINAPMPVMLIYLNGHLTTFRVE